MGFLMRPIAGRFAAVLGVCLLAGCQGGAEVANQIALRQKLAQADQKANIASLSEVIKTNPNDANALNLRGAAFGQSGDHEKALDDFNAAISISPQYYQAYANRALIYARVGRLDQALTDYDQALSIDPRYSVALIGRGNIHRMRKNYPMAVADYTQALEIQADPIAFFNRGLSYQAMGQHYKAVDDFDNTLGYRSDAPEVYHAKGLSELALQKYEKAYEDFYQAARGRKDNYEAWALRGRAAEGMGQKKEAAQAYRRALQINPSYGPAREGLYRVGGEA